VFLSFFYQTLYPKNKHVDKWEQKSYSLANILFTVVDASIISNYKIYSLNLKEVTALPLLLFVH
jgi:hypothetical protein